MYNYLLLPGRHHAITKFQVEYLKTAIQQGSLQLLDGSTAQFDRTAQVVWAVTSANHANTRRNPIAGSRRLGMIEAVAEHEGLPSQVYLIPNMAEKPDFAHYLVEEIYLQSRSRLRLRPEDCVVACSTPAVIAQYRALGYAIAPVELSDEASGAVNTARPWDIVEELIASGADWRSNASVRDDLHPICFQHYERYGLGDQIVETFQDPLTQSSDGDITTTRDYDTYRASFEQNAFRKVEVFASEVQPGRILDVGCATGQTLKLLTEIPELFESDFYGVEAARPLFDICNQRKSNGEFGNANVFFYQRNIMRSALFPKNSLNTIITMALTHEIESYLGRDNLLTFLHRMYDMTAPGGVYINYDVVGPDNKDQKVYADLRSDDGENPAELFPELDGAALSDFLGRLSTRARFERFVHDFRHDEGDQITVAYEMIDGTKYAVLRYADLCDFLAKKDYIDSWHSEMHERFCFWEYADWVEALENVGFEVKSTSHRIQNPWLIENRFAPAASVFVRTAEGTLTELAPPDTNVLLVATKPA